MKRPVKRKPIFMDGYDDAIVGIWNNTVIYDKIKVIKILMKDMSHQEAKEYFNYQIAGTYVGATTPMFISGADRAQIEAMYA